MFILSLSCFHLTVWVFLFISGFFFSYNFLGFYKSALGRLCVFICLRSLLMFAISLGVFGGQRGGEGHCSHYSAFATTCAFQHYICQFIPHANFHEEYLFSENLQPRDDSVFTLIKITQGTFFSMKYFTQLTNKTVPICSIAFQMFCTESSTKVLL